MNIQELNERLLAARVEAAERERLLRLLASVESELEQARQELSTRDKALRRENADVLRLECTSLVGLIYAILGTKESRLEQERQDLLQAKLKHEMAAHKVTGLENDLADLQRRLTPLHTAPERYTALLEEKERLLNEQPGGSSRRLEELAGRLSDLTVQNREIEEAILAGRSAQQGLEKVVAALESASGWGTWDLFGGGMLSSAIKHSHLDEAHKAAQDTQPRLVRFQRELADVDSSLGAGLEIGALESFLDIFFDNLLVDLLVQSKINESLEAARSTHKRVGTVVGTLASRQQSLEAQLQQAAQERRAFLEQA